MAKRDLTEAEICMRYITCVFRADLGADSGGIWALIPG